MDKLYGQQEDGSYIVEVAIRLRVKDPIAFRADQYALDVSSGDEAFILTDDNSAVAFIVANQIVDGWKNGENADLMSVNAFSGTGSTVATTPHHLR